MHFIRRSNNHSAVFAGTPSDPTPEGIPGTWTLVKRDEFDGASLDLDLWTPNWLNNDPAAITQPVNTAEDAAYDPAQVVVEGGVCKLKVVADPITIGPKEYPYRAGMIQSYSPSPGKYMKQLGAFEARIWFDNDGSNGIPNFPAWWLNGTSNPAHGEPDIVEGRGGQAKWAYHTTPESMSGPDNPTNMTGWHTYGLEWSVGALRYYYDGVQVGQVSNNVAYANPLYLVLNHGVGGGSSGTIKVPSEMHVDYVRVWDKTNPTVYLAGLGGGTGGSAADMAIVMPAEVTANDLLLVVGGLSSTTNFGTNPSGWTDINTGTQGSVRGRFWRKTADGTEDGTTVNFPNGSSSVKTGGVFSYRGVTSIVDTATATGDGSHPYQVSITTTVPNTTVICMMWIDGSSGSPSTTDWTGQGGIRFDGAYKHSTNGDWAVIGSGQFPSAGTYSVGFTATETTVQTRSAVLSAISVT